MESQKVALIIMDGWGHGKIPQKSAIDQAKTPFVDSLYSLYPNTELITHGEDVGLPEGQMGNSEVGHMNLGAGRLVYQDLLRINNAIKNGDLANNEILNKAISQANKEEVSIHLMGLVSDGGVHSSLYHLKSLCEILSAKVNTSVYIHCFTDGRDTDPKSGISYLSDLSKYIENTCVSIASIIGRFYAMDRDNRWERIKKAYNLLVKGEGTLFNDVYTAMSSSYDNGITDEFMEPIVLNKSANVKEGDVVICFNFRTDRCREITQALTQKDFPEYEMDMLNLNYYTMTVYDSSFKNVSPIFKEKDLSNTLGEVIENSGKEQLRIAETEKYPHVSFFFSGGVEAPFKGEKRIMVSSPKVTTYDLKPEMSAFELKDRVIQEINSNEPDFICLNFANADMVGHTGVFDAAVKAVEAVDKSVESVIHTALSAGYTIFLTADHGNSDMMINPDGSPNTAHTTNLVPLFLISRYFRPKLKAGKLADVAPSILKIMGLDIPEVMDGQVLWEE